jgi:hypothetical protein
MVKKKEVVKKKSFFKRRSNFNVLDIGLTKLSVFFFALFIISFLSGNAINGIIELRLLWLVLFVLLAIKPLIKFFRR